MSATRTAKTRRPKDSARPPAPRTFPEGERRFRAVFDAALDAMIVLDDEGHYVEANPAACALLGRSHADIVSRSVGGVSPPGMDPTGFWRKVRTEGRASGRWRIARPDGTTREVEFQATAGVLQGLNLAVIRDVTERERRATQLQALADAALAIGSAASLEEITRVVTESARLIIGTHQSVTSFSVDENWAQAIHAVSLSDKYAGYRSYDAKPDGSGIYRLVCRDNRALRLTQAEMEAHPAWRGFGAEASRHPPMRGWLAVPLKGRDGRNIGLIQLSDKYEGEFGEDDEAIVVQLAALASEAVENARLLQEVRLAHERMQALSWRLVHLQEEERRTIARELHDELGQILTSLMFLVEANGRAETAMAGERVNEMTRQVLERIRDLSLNLRPPMLDDLGLVPTLHWHFERYRSQTGIDVCFRHSAVHERPGSGQEITAFRIIQEALTNVARHARVTRATVDLWMDDGHLYVCVEDEGRGFDPDAVPPSSSGLTGMRERALLLGGTVEIVSAPGRGTRLVATLPLRCAPRAK